jgi:hypothetical protein
VPRDIPGPPPGPHHPRHARRLHPRLRHHARRPQAGPASPLGSLPARPRAVDAAISQTRNLLACIAGRSQTATQAPIGESGADAARAKPPHRALSPRRAASRPSAPCRDLATGLHRLEPCPAGTPPGAPGRAASLLLAEPDAASDGHAAPETTAGRQAPGQPDRGSPDSLSSDSKEECEGAAAAGSRVPIAPAHKHGRAGHPPPPASRVTG